jgi:UDP-2,4-diacetamido-2,4,6-trideoxy-beta-L-altropyranose hydrolase
VSTKKIIIRADGNLATGLGHIYRGIAIAEMLRGNFDCVFVTGHDSVKGIIPHIFPVSYLPSTVSTATESDWLQTNFNPADSVIIADGYHFGSGYQRKLKEKGYPLIYIDDQHSEHMFADIVINHSPLTNKSVYKTESYTELFLGCDYALLRKLFLENAKEGYSVPVKLSRCLVTMGGSDEFNISGKIAGALTTIKDVEEIDIVIGSAFPHRKELEGCIALSPVPIHIHSNVSEKEMVTLMKNCEFAISPSSTTCLELIAMKKIIFSGITASNQAGLYSYFTSKQLVFDLGDLKERTSAELAKIISANLQLTGEFAAMLKSQQQLIDGRSGERINQIVKKLAEC